MPLDIWLTIATWIFLILAVGLKKYPALRALAIFAAVVSSAAALIVLYHTL